MIFDSLNQWCKYAPLLHMSRSSVSTNRIVNTNGPFFFNLQKCLCSSFISFKWWSFIFRNSCFQSCYLRKDRNVITSTAKASHSYCDAKIDSKPFFHVLANLCCYGPCKRCQERPIKRWHLQITLVEMDPLIINTVHSFCSRLLWKRNRPCNSFSSLYKQLCHCWWMLGKS